jgi:hypothetical protein
MLIIHSEEDWRCPINQAEELWMTLRMLGRDVTFYRFPGENHELSRSGSPVHRRMRAEIILDFFAERLTAPSTRRFPDRTPPRHPANGFATATLEMVSEDEDALDAAIAISVASGGTVLAAAPGVALVDLPPRAWPAVAAVAGVEVRRPMPVAVRPERAFLPEFGPTVGPAVAITGADAWHAAGIDGAGVRIGVIDFFDTQYWNAAEHGPLPLPGVTAVCFRQGADCTPEFFDGEDLGGEDHGVAVVEILRDMAPGAEILIGQAETLTDYELLIDWFADRGVDVISRSLGSRYDGPGDGRGALDEIAERAVQRGITWVNSGGNNGQGQYYRQAGPPGR